MEIFSQINNNINKNHSNFIKKDDMVQYIKDIETKNSAEDKNRKEDKTLIHESLKDLNTQMNMLNTDIEFSFDEDSKSFFVKVKEKSTGKIIRTIPSEEAMKFYKKVKDFIGIIFDKKG